MIVRDFEAKDAEACSKLINENFDTILTNEYTPEAIEEIKTYKTPEKLIEQSIEIQYFVAEEKGKILGIGGLKGNKLSNFFVDLNSQKKGVGTQLVQAVLKKAKEEGFEIIETASTQNAVKFYSKLGFQRLREVDKSLPSGLKFKYILMTKTL